MAIRFYDEAIVNKIQKWLKKETNVMVLKPNEVSRLWQTKADQENDKPLTLPLIAISREPSVNMSVSTRRNLTCDGVKLDGTPLKSLQLDAIPISINYQIDIYTKRYDEGDEYLRNFIFNFVNHPQMTVELPYNGANIEHICYTRLNNTVTDNSDVSEKLYFDEFTRWSLQVEIHDAYLFSVPVKDNAKIVAVDFEMANNLGITAEKVDVTAIDTNDFQFNGEVPEIDTTSEENK